MRALLLIGMVALTAGAACMASAPARSAAPAADKPADAPMTPVHNWTGSIADLSLEKKAPEKGFVADQRTWDALREAWGLPEEAKKVDLDDQLVLIGTTRGGTIGGKPTLSEKGDLKFVPISTRDLRPGFRYLIVVVPREGVKTVNGKPIE